MKSIKNIIQAIKSINIRQILTVFLAGCLLVVSTACSKGSVAQAGSKAGMEASRLASDTYDKYDAKEAPKGGMNKYNDDRRYDSKAAAKAKTLVDTAKRRQADNMGEFTDNVLERSVGNEGVNERATESFSRKLERNKDKAANYVDNKSDKLGRNLEKVPGGVKNVVKGAADTAQNAVEDASRATKKTSRNIKNNFEDLGN